MTIRNINFTKLGSGSIKQESLSNQITINNTVTFTINETPKNSKIILTLNGQTLTPGDNKDYTITQRTITVFDSSHIIVGDELIVTYIT